jgi:sugar phosphate permease
MTSQRTTQTNGIGSWLAIVVVSLASSFYFYEFFLRVMPTVITGELMAAFSVGTGQLGQLLGCFFYAYALMQLPAGLLCDRFGAKNCLTVAVCVCAIATLCFQITNSIVLASISRLAIGAASAFAFIGPLALSARWFAPSQQALITGLVQIMGCVGAVLAGKPIRMMVQSIGWRPALYYAGLLGLFMTLLFALVLKNQPDTSADDAPVAENSKPSTNIIDLLRQVATHKVNWYVGIGAFGSWAAVAIFAESWGVPYLSLIQGQGDDASALQLMWVWISMAIASPLAGWVSDHMKERVRPTMVLLGLALVASIILIMFKPSNYWVVSMLLFAIGTSSAAQPITFGLINDLNDDESMATAISLNNMILVCSTGILTPISGYLLEIYAPITGAMPTTIAPYQAAFMIVPISIIICMAIFYWYVPETGCQRLTRTREEEDTKTFDQPAASV